MAGLVAALLLIGVATAAAQEAPEGRPAAGWDDGFFLQSSDGDNRIQFGLFAQFDSTTALADEEDTIVDTLALRRFRPTIRGRVARNIEFVFQPEFAGGTFSLQDAYVETRFSRAFRLRLGKSKFPAAFERLQSDAYLFSMERALPAAIAPNRDIGIQAHGDLAGGRVSYIAAILNGTRDGGSSDADTNDGKDLAGRVTVEVLDGLQLGIAGSTGNHSGAPSLPVYRTSLLQQVFFSYANASADGRLNRFASLASFYRRAFGAFVEYAQSSVPVAHAGIRQTMRHDAWQVAGAYVLTGENASDNGVTPRAPFNPASGDWGAFEVAARYHALSIDDDAFELGMAAPGASRTATAWSAGVNWYLSRMVVCRAQFERTVFDEDAGGRPPETALAFRSQLNF